MALPIRTLPVLQNWDCHVCGTCCKEYQVTVSDEERLRIEAQGWDRNADLGGLDPFLRHGWRQATVLGNRFSGKQDRLISRRRPGIERPADLDPVEGQAGALVVVELSLAGGLLKVPLAGQRPAGEDVHFPRFQRDFLLDDKRLVGRDVTDGAHVVVFPPIQVAADAHHGERLAGASQRLDGNADAISLSTS